MRSSSRRVDRAVQGALLLAGVLGSSAAPGAQTPVPPVRDLIITAGTQRFAVPACVPRAGDEASVEACRTISRVLRDDLAFERLFPFVEDRLLSALPAFNPDAVKLDDWRGIGANVLVITRAGVAKPAGRAEAELTVEVRVQNVDSGETVLSRRYTGRADNPRVFAHQASDDIVAQAQYRGVARTRIAFSSDRDSGQKKGAKELYIVDYDGYNPRRVTVNGSLNVLPAWSPDGRSVAYVSWRQGTPLVFLASIFEGKSTPNLTGERSGNQAFAPAFSPDGKRIAFASNRSGNMDVWVADADGGGARRLTSHPASDTAPAWSPTGQQIAFTSDRTGTPQIWTMGAEGLNQERLTRVGSYNDGATWNPSKEYSEIAYTSRLEGGGFDIAVLDYATGQVRQITQGRGSCEYPSWAPNGRHLVFSCRRGGTWQLAVADREGRDFRVLAAGPGNNVYPDWGP